MPTTIRSTPRCIKAVVTASSRVAASELARELGSEPSLQVSFATHCENLWQEIEAIRPDVVLLDTRIAGNGAPSLVKELVDRARLPVLIRTEIGENSPEMLIDCIDAGALGIVNKPANIELAAQAVPALIWNLKALAGASIANLQSQRAATWPIADDIQSDCVLALGAPTGGALPLGRLLMQLPAGCPGAVAIVPLPIQVIGPWADRLGTRCGVRVKQAADGDLILPGQVLVAPGERHLVIRRHGADWAVKINDGPAVFHQKPSIEVLFNSVADTIGSNAVGVLLGGAGVDGIAGLLHLRKSGGRTLTESPDTSIFADLPQRALQCGAAESHAPANELASQILELAKPRQIHQAA